MPRFAANISMMFTEVPFLERFAAAARAGFKGVEFLFPYEHAPDEIARRLADNGLTNVLFNLPPGDWMSGERGLSCLPGREAEFRDSVDRALAYAGPLDTPRLHIMAGLVPDGMDREWCRATYVANLRHAAHRLAEHEITALIEPINARDMPGYFIIGQAEAHAIVVEVGASNLKVQLDLYHAQVAEGDLAMLLKRYIGNGVGHIQIAGVPDRHEPDDGEVNYPYLFERIDALGYDGWIGCEYRPRGRTEEGLSWLGRS